MSSPEHPIQADRDQQLANLVGFMLETHDLELELAASRGFPIPEPYRPMLGTVRLVVPGTAYEAGQRMLIRERKLLINAHLLRLGGIQATLDNTDTNRKETTTFTAWHGLAEGRNDLHIWSRHTPDREMTVSTTFLHKLWSKYTADSTNPQSSVSEQQRALYAGYL